MGIALSVSMAAGQATRPAGADTTQRPASPQVAAPSPTTSPQAGASVEQDSIRRRADDDQQSGTRSATRRDGTGKPVAPPPSKTSGPSTGSSSSSSSSSSSFELRRVALSLGAVVGLIFLLYWLAKRLFPTVAAARSSQAVRVLSRSVLSPKQQVLLLQVGRRVIVVGDTGAQMNPLAEITDPDEVASLVGQVEAEKRPSVTAAFGGLFGRARDSFDADPEPSPQLPATDVSDEGEAEGIVERRAAQDDQPPVQLGLDEARGELRGLMDKVK